MMIRHLSFFPKGAVLLFGTALFVAAQAPVPPPVPPLSQEQKAAAAAIQAPATLTPPPLPGQVLPGAQAQVPATVAPAPPVPPLDSSASKLQALEAATQQSMAQEAPRVAAPSDKIPITSSTSTSGQFIVHGKVFETRSAMSSRCEDYARDLRKVLNDKEPWVLPVVVLLNTGEAAAKTTGAQVATAITEMSHGGFHVQVTINDRGGLKETDLRREIVRALLAERILRNQQKITKPESRLLLPDWVMTGVLHAMEYKASARPSAIFSTIFRSGKIYGIEEIIAASPVEMDGLSRTIYETSCCALVLALADQPDGPQRFNKFLNALANDPRSERDLLNAAFPNFAASASSLNKWWSLQLAALSKPGIGEPYTPADSFQAVEEAVLIRYTAKPDEIPQGIKPRPIVLPTPLVFSFPTTPKPAAPTAQHEPPRHSPAPASARPRETADSPPAATPGAAAATTPAAEADTTTPGNEEGKRALWRRMLFLGDSKPDDKPVETTPIPPPASASASAEPEEKEKVKDKDKPGLFGRLLGGGSDKKKPAEEPPAPAPEPAPAKAQEKKPKPVAAASAPKPSAKPAAPPSEEPKPKEEEKSSKLNPLKWFRGGKKPAEDKKDEAPAQGSQTSLLPSSQDINFARLLSPALADAWQMLAPAAPRQTVDPLFFLRKKKASEEAPAPAPPEAPQAAPAPKKSTSRPSKSKSGPPRTTNPNSKSTAKPDTSVPGVPQTTNPNSRPVPGAMVPPAVAGATAGSVNPASGLVPVILPLEEYKHIMKREDRAEILDHNIATLRALELRVSILFRPVVTAYLAIVTDLKEGKTKDMDKRIAVMRQFTVIAYQKSVAVRDYLDHYEANEGLALSGKFNDFLDLPATIEKELPPRLDPISKYLDAIDKEFSK